MSCIVSACPPSRFIQPENFKRWTSPACNAARPRPVALAIEEVPRLVGELTVPMYSRCRVRIEQTRQAKAKVQAKPAGREVGGQD